MACDASSAVDFPDKAAFRATPCTCGEKCRGQGSSMVFLGLFLLSLCLHAVTLVCYLDLRSEVKREKGLHQRRESVMTLTWSDPAGVLPPGGHPRQDSHSGDSRQVLNKVLFFYKINCGHLCDGVRLKVQRCSCEVLLSPAQVNTPWLAHFKLSLLVTGTPLFLFKTRKEALFDMIKTAFNPIVLFAESPFDRKSKVLRG